MNRLHPRPAHDPLSSSHCPLGCAAPEASPAAAVGSEVKEIRCLRCPSRPRRPRQCEIMVQELPSFPSTQGQHHLRPIQRPGRAARQQVSRQPALDPLFIPFGPLWPLTLSPKNGDQSDIRLSRQRLACCASSLSALESSRLQALHRQQRLSHLPGPDASIAIGQQRGEPEEACRRSDAHLQRGCPW